MQLQRPQSAPLAEGLALHLRELALSYKLMKEPDGLQENHLPSEYFGPESLVAEVRSKLRGCAKEQVHMELHSSAVWLRRLLGLVLDDPEHASIGATSETLWRLRWQMAFVSALVAHLSELLGQRKSLVSFFDDAKEIYDCHVDPEYASEKVVSEILAKFSAQVGSSDVDSNLETWRQTLQSAMIPEENYEQTFRSMLQEVMHIIGDTVPLERWSLEQECFSDLSCCFEATCGYKGNRTSVMKVNTARPIDLCKCQQLASHEFTHHIQFCIVEEMLLPHYPEFHCDIDFGPWSFILEAGAEVAVDCLFTPTRRKAQLKALEFHLLSSSEVEKIVDLDSLAWREMWRVWTAVAQDLVDGRVSKDEAILLQKRALKTETSWPNTDFMQQYGAYILGYGYGSELMRRYLKQKSPGTEPWKAYVEFMKRPEPPSVMWNALRCSDSGGF